MVERKVGGLSNIFWPGDEWERDIPENQRVNSRELDGAMKYLENICVDDGVSQAIVIRNGKIIWEGDRIDFAHNVWSCTKSFTSTVLGLLIDDGKCSLNTPAHKYAPFLAERYNSVTLRHFTTMTSGYNAVGRTYDEDGSLTPFVPDEPVFPPGSKFMYWDDAMNAFGYVLTALCGGSVKEYFKTRIADRIGMVNWEWRIFEQAGEIPINGTAGNHDAGIHISAEELARLGLLFLRRGYWRETQLISHDWINMATTVQVGNSYESVVYPGRPYLVGGGVYGFNWWVNGVCRDGNRLWPNAPVSTYCALGHRNNILIIIPEWDMVVVRLGLDEIMQPLQEYTGFFEHMQKAIAV